MANAQVTEEIRETAMVDLAYEYLKSNGEPQLYRVIMDVISKKKGFTKQETEQYIAQLYTAINIDGRFVCVGRSLWGLKHWYPIEQSTDSAIVANVKDDYDHDLDDEDLFGSDDDDFTDEIDDLESSNDFDDDDQEEEEDVNGFENDEEDEEEEEEDEDY
ncbi:DNA-directed RNA polymerase subunit delta [Shimazuella kribbensis]|uniref:DNA-directed RNA polymerase subunit delta n=1 Tax=Shimazuella kribbensis TaxID=139808 RepID=UPI000407524C|nr:DNA-directed RNA polymerase subunit delta [Shimazuella kribbensis]